MVDATEFSEFADGEHRAQAEEWFLELGRFAVEFERVCEGMRHAIVSLFQSEGLQHPGFAKVVIGEKSSVELQVLLGALLVEMRGRTDEADSEAIRSLLKEVKTLTEKRNVVIHSAWWFGTTAASTELYATAIRPRTKQNTGARPEIQGVSAPYLRHLTEQSANIGKKLFRLRICIERQDLKFSTVISEGDASE